jgi:hypothetical protein
MFFRGEDTNYREIVMKPVLLFLGVILSTIAVGTPAKAQNYPWCALYTGALGGENCGFSTYAQCAATVSGIGGFCQPNTQYVPAAGPSRRRRT